MPDNGELPLGGIELDDQELVALVVYGNRQAIRRFVDRFTPLVRAFLIRRMRLSAADADDVTQRVFEKLWQDNWRALRNWHGDNLAAYLRTTARNLAIDFIRSHSPVLAPEDPPDERLVQGSLFGTQPEQPEDQRFQGELRDAISGCLDRGPDRDRKLIESSHFLGLSYQEISEQLRMTVNAVGVALHRAEARLRQCLQRLHPGIAALFCAGEV